MEDGRMDRAAAKQKRDEINAELTRKKRKRLLKVDELVYQGLPNRALQALPFAETPEIRAYRQVIQGMIARHTAEINDCGGTLGIDQEQAEALGLINEVEK